MGMLRDLANWIVHVLVPCARARTRQRNFSSVSLDTWHMLDWSALADQRRRAATAIPMNIAEAVGEISRADRMNKFAIARGEAMECGAILDVVKLLDVIPISDINHAKALLVRTVEMLTKLCR
jgi:four helix bundle protein